MILTQRGLPGVVCSQIVSHRVLSGPLDLSPRPRCVTINVLLPQIRNGRVFRSWVEKEKTRQTPLGRGGIDQGVTEGTPNDH